MADYIVNKYNEFKSKYGYIPKYFNPYNCYEITDYAPTITSAVGSTTVSSTILIVEGIEDNKNE